MILRDHATAQTVLYKIVRIPLYVSRHAKRDLLRNNGKSCVCLWQWLNLPWFRKCALYDVKPTINALFFYIIIFKKRAKDPLPEARFALHSICEFNYVICPLAKKPSLYSMHKTPNI